MSSLIAITTRKDIAISEQGEKEKGENDMLQANDKGRGSN